MKETLPTDVTRVGPTGLTLRPYAGEADLPVIVNIMNRQFEADGVPFREDVGHIGAWYSRASDQFDPARDVTLAEVDGVPVGYSDRSWVDTTLEPKIREYRLDGAVLPEWRRQGIGTALLRNNQERQRQLAQTHDTNLPRAFGSWTSHVATRLTGAYWNVA